MKNIGLIVAPCVLLGLAVSYSVADDPSCHGDLIPFCEDRHFQYSFYCCYTNGSGCCQYVCNRIDCGGEIKVEEVYLGSYTPSACQASGKCTGSP